MLRPEAERLLEEIAGRHRIAAAEAHVDNARLQRVQLRYVKAAEEGEDGQSTCKRLTP